MSVPTLRPGGTPPPVAQAGARAPGRRGALREVFRVGGVPRRVPLGLALPGVAFALAVHFIAPAAGAVYAFTDWNGINSPAFVGLDNFREIFRDAVQRDALLHTLQLAGSFLVLVNAIGLGLALGLNRLLKTRLLLRTILFAPVALSPIAVAYIWRFVFEFSGPLNGLLATLGLESWQRDWLGDPTWALWTVLVTLVWQFSGLTMMMYLAGLQSIPDELIEASAVDGAGHWMRFRRIVLPLLAPAFTVSITLTLIFGLRVFDQVLALTGGGPVDSTETLATQVWEQAFVLGRFGYGASLALVLTALVAVLALSQLVLLRRQEQRL